jgi:Ca2+-binding EF-hand superfamily protein
MMKKRLFAMFLIVFLSLCFSFVMAQDTPKEIFSQIDADKDGKVTKDEFMTFHMEPATKIREARFDQLDTNKDGKITRDEFMTIQLEEARKIGDLRFNAIDSNKDGVLSENEVITRFRLIKEMLERLKQE